MISNEKVVTYFWRLSLVFMTYLLLGSFVVSKNYYDLLYLICLYGVLIVGRVFDKRDE